MDCEWKEVSSEGEVRHAGVTAVIVDDRDIALYAVNGAIYATENRCTHGHARLSDGFLLDDEIECPLHQGRFNVRDGRPVCAPLTKAVQVFPVKVDWGRVFVLVPVSDGDATASKSEPAGVCLQDCPSEAPQ